MKPLIHFAHANGVPSKVYQKLFDLLKDDYDIIFVSLLGPDKRYPIDNHWASLTQQVIDSIVQQAQGRKVIGLGHSLGSVLTFQAALKHPELFSQVIMLDPPLIMGKDGFALHIAKTFKLKAVDRMSPASLSLRRRDHWQSRAQAAKLLRPKGFYKAFDGLGIGYAKTAVGDKYVYEYMTKNGCRIGGEQSGHIIFSKYASIGDGNLTRLKMMEVMMAKKKKMSQLTENLHIYL